MPPLPADSIHARACKLKCEKILTRPPLRGLHCFPRPPPKGKHPPCVCPPSEGLTTEHTDTLTAHREHPGGRSFFHPFSVREGNTFYMARRRQEQTHTQRRDRDMEW